MPETSAIGPATSKAQDWPDAPSPWSDALLACKVLTVCKRRIGGITVKARSGPVRDRFLAHLQSILPADCPQLRINSNTDSDALLGALDISATLQAGKPIYTSGLIARANKGIITIAMAENLEKETSSLLANALDCGTLTNPLGETVHSSFCVVALDEGIEEDEAIASGLKDRLALTVDLSHVALGDTDALNSIASPPLNTNPAAVEISPELRRTLVEIAQKISPASLRPAIWLMEITRAVAALEGCKLADANHAATAMRLIFGPIQTSQPDEKEVEAEEPQDEPDTPPENDPSQQNEDPPEDENENNNENDDESDENTQELSLDDLQNMAIQAANALRPEVLENGVANGMNGAKNAQTGKSGANQKGASRGRPVGTSQRPPYPGAKLNINATLRTAAPWQVLRRKAKGFGKWQPGDQLLIHPSDFRYSKFRHQTESTAIFVVDASGSTALARLGETKGAIELLLADCYVRRDQVALIAFRGKEAETILEPTRSLVRAKRSLAQVPGGGGTPLASGMKQAMTMADQLRRKGQTPLIILMTDGKGNVALDGTADRKTAGEETAQIARQIALNGFQSVFIDMARRRDEKAVELANQMRADYCPLPNANAAAVSGIVSDYLKQA